MNQSKRPHPPRKLLVHQETKIHRRGSEKKQGDESAKIYNKGVEYKIYGWMSVGIEENLKRDKVQCNHRRAGVSFSNII